MFLLSALQITEFNENCLGKRALSEEIMDTETLRSFIVLAESESISQAARKLYIAQSALSNRLKALEKECGATLIERDYHNFRLTQSGQQLYERAQKIVELAESAIAEIKTADSGLSGTLNISATPSLATGILRDFLKRYCDKYPAVNVRVYEGATPSVLSRLEDGIADVALVRTPYTNNGMFSAQTVDNDRMMILSSQKLPSTIDFEQLFENQLILTHRYHAMLSRIAARMGRTLKSPVACEEIATCIALTETGLGITMIPQSTYENYAAHGTTLFASLLENRECDTACELVFLKNRHISAAARNFAEIVLRKP